MRYSFPLWIVCMLSVTRSAVGQEAKPYISLVLEGKFRWINYMAFSNDGAVFAASHCWSHGPSFVTLWDAKTGNKLRTVDGPEGTLGFNVLAFSPDGKQFAVGGIDEIRVIDLHSGKLLHQFKEPHPDVHDLAFSPNRQMLASCGRDNEVVLWDLKTGRRTVTLRHDRPWVFSVAFSPDGKKLTALGFSSDEGRTVGWQTHRWDVATSKPLAQARGAIDENFEYGGLSPDGEVVAIRKAARLQLRDSASGKLRGAIDMPGDEESANFAFSGDNKYVITIGREKKNENVTGRLDRWDITTGKNVGSKLIPEAVEGYFLLAPRGDVLAVRDGESTIKLWRARDLLPPLK
jgi:WD40 repeat protein